jgi:aspartyl protease family protein
MRIKSFLLSVILLYSFQGFSQLKFSDFKDFPLGIDFNNYREIKTYFDKKPLLMKGELKDAFEVRFDNVSFDKYGSADYTFQFVNNVLTSVEIEFSFNSKQIGEFENFIKSLRNDLQTDATKIHITQSSNFKMLDAINYTKKECKGEEGPDVSEKYRDIPYKFFGYDVWAIKNSSMKDGRFFLISGRLRQTDRQWYDFDAKKQHEYHGGMVGVTISFTNEKLQELRNWEIQQDKQGYTSFEEQKKVIKLKEVNGIYKLPVNINNTLTLDFVLDLGASDVSLSPDIFSVLYKAGKVDESDFIGTQTYKFADGSSAKSSVINLRTLTIGEIKLENVRASISNSIDAPLLLGQSALKQLGTYSIDNVNKQLVVE